jgi:hypothetical protein
MMTHIVFNTQESKMHLLSQMINLEIILSSLKIKYSIPTEINMMIRVKNNQLWILTRKKHQIKKLKGMGILETKIK